MGGSTVQHGVWLAVSMAAAFLVSTSMAGEQGGDYSNDYTYGESECEHDSFYCDAQDPAMFHRCLEGIYHTFSCPSGLHFSVKTQTCDWPHQADCSSGTTKKEEESPSEPSYDYHGGDDFHHGNGHQHKEEISVVSDRHSDFDSFSDGSSWISQAAAGKPWWRPEGVQVSQIQDLKEIKTPAHVVHIPDEKDEKDEKPKSKAKAKPQAKKQKKKRVKKIGATKVAVSSANSGSASPDRQNSGSVGWKEGNCDPSTCQIPHCYCAGSKIPNGLSRSSTPQMVMITFDDEVSPANYGYYQRLFRPGRYNPNGCPVRGGLFVSGSGTVYDLVYPLYAMGMEIASHSISHRFPHTWWSSASYQEYVQEVSGMRENLVSQAGVPHEHIKGFRVPFLQLGADSMYGALYDSKFTYDTSMFTGAQWEGADEPAWPFTLDYVPPITYCQHGPCPKKQYPGMWEIPVQRWYGLDGHSCAMADGCGATGDDEETLEYLKTNFRRYYGSNRAPFGIFVHARWFETEHNLDGLDKFIDYLQSLDDVYVVTPSQVVEWMKKPTPLSSVHGFEPWSCGGAASDMWKK